MRELFIINVNITGNEFVQGKTKGVAMVSFTADTVSEWFTGKTIGQCVDTQNIYGENRMSLSARYMLEGTDKDGQKCRMFIENNGDSFDTCVPSITTDSEALSFLETSKLGARVEPYERGVKIHILIEE